MPVIYTAEDQPVIVDVGLLRRLRARGLVARKRRGHQRRFTAAGERWARALYQTPNGEPPPSLDDDPPSAWDEVMT